MLTLINLQCLQGNQEKTYLLLINAHKLGDLTLQKSTLRVGQRFFACKYQH